jgi:hypothetical protein
MPSRKQRRRREKLQRHEWEFVQYDDEGNEVAVEAPPAKKEKEKPRQAQAKESNGKPARSGRFVREVKPPSWNRAIKRALLFVPFLFIFLSIGKHPPSVPTRILISVLYAAVFVPMFFFVDRLAYRAYKRRTGDA